MSEYKGGCILLSRELSQKRHHYLPERWILSSVQTSELRAASANKSYSDNSLRYQVTPGPILPSLNKKLHSLLQAKSQELFVTLKYEISCVTHCFQSSGCKLLQERRKRFCLSVSVSHSLHYYKNKSPSL